MNPNFKAFAHRAKQLLNSFRLPKRALIIALVGVLSVGGVVPANSSSSVFYDFDIEDQLTDEFDVYVPQGAVQQSATGGIGNTGAISVTDNTTKAVLASKSKYALAGSGSKYTFTSFLQSGGIGFGGVGFTGLAFDDSPGDPAADHMSSSKSRPKDALGISVHGGGFIFHNGNSDYAGNWDDGDKNIVKSIKTGPGGNLLVGGDWYKVVFSIEQTSSTLFEMIVEVWKANSNGTLLNPAEFDASFKVSDLTNAAISNAASISSYISLEGDRVRYLDNYSVSLNGSTVVEPDFPVVLTSSTSQADDEITLTGDVTSDGGATVSERGMVYGTSSGPVISGNKITAGDGTGTFTATTPTLAPGTYFVRAYATNATGTSYGAESTIEILDLTAPTLLSSSPADGSGFVSNTTDITLTFNEDVAVGTGNISIVESDNPGSVILLDVTGSEVTVTGSAVTLNPATDLALGKEYHVLIPVGAIKDLANNDFAGISTPTVLAFETAKVPLSGLEVALDASIAASYAGTGDVWEDLSGNNNDVKLDGIPTAPASKVLPGFNSTDKAIVFDAAEGQHGFFFDGTNPTTNLLNEAEYTKLVWFKPTSLTNSNNLFSSAVKNAHAFWGGGNLASCDAGGGDNLASGHNDARSTVQSGECLETQWQLAAVSFNSDSNAQSAGWRMFRNGVVVGTSTDTAEITDGSNGTPNRMGYQTLIASYNYGNFFDGEIGQVYLYNRALSAAEINDIFDASAAQYGLNLKTVSFDANGGTVDIASLRSNAGDGKVTLRTSNKAQSGFLGWFTASSGGTRVGGAGESYTPLADITLFAQWESIFTVSYSAGTNATGAPASASYQNSLGPITLPTPQRADYLFEGWFTAATDGTKVGDAGDNYIPSADITLYGQWTQASLAGIPPADLSEIFTVTIQDNSEVSSTWTVGSSSVSVNIPANALPANTVVKLYSVANSNRAKALLPSESDFVNSMVVAWTALDTTVPVASSALSMVIVDASIKSGAKVYSIVGNTSTLIGTATTDGSVSISFTTDPLVTIANPVSAPAPTPSSGGGFVGPAVTTPPVLLPSLAENQDSSVMAGREAQISLLGENLDLVSKVRVGDQELNFSQTAGTSITLTLPAMAAGSVKLIFEYGSGELEHSLVVLREQKVNAGSFKGVVALYAKGYLGQRLSAKVGGNWIVAGTLGDDFVRIIQPTRQTGVPLKVQIYVDRKLVRIVDVVTR
jgi:uncharacterized repeat protein (TIGR02543 family)